MRATLTTTLPIDRLAVFAEMAWLERRPELGALCRGARDAGGCLDATVVEAALPGLGDAGRENLVRWCRMLGLVDGGGALTALGHETAETDRAPVPEQGVYGLWVTAHPIVGRPILEAERLPVDRSARFESVEPLRRAPDLGTLHRSVLDPEQAFVLRDLPCNHGQPGRLVEPGVSRSELTWTIDFESDADGWRMAGILDVGAGPETFQTEPRSAGIDSTELLADWARGPLRAHGSWDPQRGLLQVAFASVDREEARTFRRSLTLERVEIDEAGAWSDVELDGVPIGPATDEEALAWGVALLVERVCREPAPRTRAQTRDLLGELTSDTPLGDGPVAVPAHEALLDRVAAEDPTGRAFWSLAAPVDLAPSRVPPPQLRELAVR